MLFTEIPFNKIETLFIDAGNTLISMDLEWFLKELEQCGLCSTVTDLMRAEASARPVVSSAIQKLKSTENKSTSVLYIRSILKRLPGAELITPEGTDEIVKHMLTAVSSNGQSQRLWNNILPGVPEALKILKDRGFRLSVVSNSDGSVQKILENLGLDHFFDEIFDSHIVGFEKPDPKIFTHALETCGAAAETTVHIGDLYHVDIEGAWAAGIGAVLLDPYGDWGGYECPKFQDLLSFAEKITGPV